MSFNDVHRARLLLFQAFYQMHIAKEDKLNNLLDDFSQENQDKKICQEFFNEMLDNYQLHANQIDAILESIVKDIKIIEVSPVELSICRLGVYELLLKPQNHFKVIVAESLKIQKKYGSEEGHKFVNGVLDKASELIRPHEK